MNTTTTFIAPHLPPPDFYIFRGFIPESYNQPEPGIDTVSVPCRMLATAGFVRTVETRLNGQQTCIGVRGARTELSEHPGSINGLIQAVNLQNGETLEQWKHHTKNWQIYQRRALTCFESISWQELPSTTHIWVQTVDEQRLLPPSIDFPLLQTYVDQILARCRNVDLSGDFAREFIATTRGWPCFWLNDRETGRRPWVNIEKSNPTESGFVQMTFNDNILKSHPPAPHNKFSYRYLPSEYSSLTYQVRHNNLKLPPSSFVQQQEDWSGNVLADSKTKHFMFGFGSLINTKSRTSSDPSAISAIPVRLSADLGYERCWNFQHPMAQLTALGVRAAENKTEGGSLGATLNGVCTPIKGAGGGDSASLPQEVLDREIGYTPVAVDSSQCECLGWARLPPNSKVWLFVPDGPKGTPPGHGLSPASLSNPILQTYVDICVLGCLEHSREFAIEFIASTKGWDGPWLDDRKIARRPWVHQPRYKEVDSLLREVIPDYFHARMLPTDYGAHCLSLSLRSNKADGEEGEEGAADGDAAESKGEASPPSKRNGNNVDWFDGDDDIKHHAELKMGSTGHATLHYN